MATPQGMQDLSSLIMESNLLSLQWKLGALTTGPWGKSQSRNIFKKIKISEESPGWKKINTLNCLKYDNSFCYVPHHQTNKVSALPETEPYGSQSGIALLALDKLYDRHLPFPKGNSY